MDPACRYLYLRPGLGVDLLFISRFHSLNRTRKQPFCLATRPRFSASGVGRPDCQLPDLCNHRLLSDRAEQSVQHYPYEGFHADSYLFPAGHRLPEMHYLYTGDIVALGFLISIYFLFKSYQQTQAAGYLFYSFFFIGAGSILFPQFTILSVLWLLEAYRFQSLTPRSFCGALLGWMLPYWMLFGHAFFYNEMELFYRPFNQLLTIGEFFNLQILQPWELAILGYLLVMFIVSAVHCIAAGFEDKIRTRAYLQFLIDLTIFLFLLIALQPIYCSALLPLLIISNSILIGHFFVLTNSKSSNVFFIISLVGLILLFAFNIWTLL